MEIKTSEEILFCSDDNFLREKKWVSLKSIIRELKKLEPVGQDVDWCAIVELIGELKNGKD